MTKEEATKRWLFRDKRRIQSIGSSKMQAKNANGVVKAEAIARVVESPFSDDDDDDKDDKRPRGIPQKEPRMSVTVIPQKEPRLTVVMASNNKEEPQKAEAAVVAPKKEPQNAVATVAAAAVVVESMGGDDDNKTTDSFEDSIWGQAL